MFETCCLGGPSIRKSGPRSCKTTVVLENERSSEKKMSTYYKKVSNSFKLVDPTIIGVFYLLNKICNIMKLYM